MNDETVQPDMPDAVRRLPKDHRGYPIFFTIFRPMDGSEPDFRDLDPERVLRCLKDRLCGVCGERLSYWIAFIVGTQSRETHYIAEPAMHRECAEYAARVCPFLSRTMDRFSNRPIPANARAFGPEEGGDPRPDMFLVITQRYEVLNVRKRPTHRYEILKMEKGPTQRYEILNVEKRPTQRYEILNVEKEPTQMIVAWAGIWKEVIPL